MYFSFLNSQFITKTFTLSISGGSIEHTGKVYRQNNYIRVEKFVQSYKAQSDG